MSEGEPKTPMCPICKKPVPAKDQPEAKAYPFCSSRCRLLDLGHWLDGDYSVEER